MDLKETRVNVTTVAPFRGNGAIQPSTFNSWFLETASAQIHCPHRLGICASKWLSFIQRKRSRAAEL